MAGVPEKVLNWLYSVLTSVLTTIALCELDANDPTKEYKDVNRTYHDAAEALSHYPSLSPRTEVYTSAYENGTSALLLTLSGTLPVTFRGATYGFPVAIWVPYAYPREPPMVYITPSQDMAVRPGQHVSGDGRVYHPYLAQWAQYWDFCEASSPKSHQYDRANHSSRMRPPNKLLRHFPRLQLNGEDPFRALGGHQRLRDLHSKGPRLLHGHRNRATQAHRLPSRRAIAIRSHHLSLRTRHNNPSRDHNISKPMATTMLRHRSGNSKHINLCRMVHGKGAMTKVQLRLSRDISSRMAKVPASLKMPMAQEVPVNTTKDLYRRISSTLHLRNSTDSLRRATHHNNILNISNISNSRLNKRHPRRNLRSTYSTIRSKSPFRHIPPVPPNPEKDALLRALSQTLVSQIRQTVNANVSALTPLRSQQAALQTAYSRLQAELGELQQLDAALASNEQILKGAMLEADRVMDDARRRQAPDVDDVLVAPTFVGGQLYTLAAEEKGIADALFVLGRALDKGRVSADVFVKFLKKALVKKIAKGMALDEYQMR
ncbi:hypothetical protein SNOG_16164 [Parastagonospora nodorum SN15]|uniref:UEV domain-containing protein n=1 Tax=Phaeosphaeria nodorum (strain SN15 / ATCC MYA-4574 / FGSC 10173) TaxID=321614 RepID=Q0TWM8_PHANO|nr:hypothetical protein SNOG_16164 [Parastagonospora nodorum SN15]EAT76536.2 hypothetical protein SNOG_16164 [Parastagonospora nodorum SN15]